jgi:hypothetical protein
MLLTFRQSGIKSWLKILLQPIVLSSLILNLGNDECVIETHCVI